MLERLFYIIIYTLEKSYISKGLNSLGRISPICDALVFVTIAVAYLDAMTFLKGFTLKENIFLSFRSFVFKTSDEIV